MSGSPAFQFYASDWAHSVSSFTLEERGAYITLLAWSWEHGPVENDIRRIALLLGVTAGHARRLWERVSRKWELRSDGLWIQPRLEQVRAERVSYIDTKRRNGAKGGRKRTETEPTANLPVNLQVSPSELSPSPISDLQEPPRRKERVSGAARARVVQDSDGRYLNAGGAWKPAEQKPTNSLFSGRDHRRHGMHAWCCDRGLCVSWGLHSDFMGRLGGEDGDRRLRVWYAQTIVRFEGQPVGDDLFEFWRNEFAAWVGTVTSRPSSSRTGDTMDAGQKSLRARLERLQAEEGESHVPRQIKG